MLHLQTTIKYNQTKWCQEPQKLHSFPKVACKLSVGEKYKDTLEGEGRGGKMWKVLTNS